MGIQSAERRLENAKKNFTQSELISRDDLIWFTGVFEGEGCISPTRTGIALNIQMTDEDIIKRLHDAIKVGSIQGPRQGRLGTKPIYTWQVSGKRDVARVLCAMAPLLGERRRAKIMELQDNLYYQRNRSIYNKGKFNG